MGDHPLQCLSMNGQEEHCGRPTSYQDRYLIWGCDRGPEAGLCVKANVFPRSLTMWELDGNLKTTAHKAYRKKVLQAKGVKGGAKFWRTWPRPLLRQAKAMEPPDQGFPATGKSTP
ncbi:MAG TPA: hypothetical protein ENN39_03595 [Desulfonatronum sp.]|nr:hypothetical protein [Desulfonatronum sp.]